MACITKVAVSGTVLDMDTIEYEDELWLVPLWIHSQDGRWKRPERIINLSKLPYERFKDSYILKIPLPAELRAETLYPPPAIPGYDVVELPDIILPSPSTTN